MSGNSPEEVNTSLLTMIRELQSKNNTLEAEIVNLSSENEQLQTFATHQKEDLTRQILEL